MRESLRYQLVIVAVAAVVCFAGLGATGLWDMDEALYGSCAREMLERHNWVVPWFNGEMFPEKPPLMFWSMIAGYELFGVNEWGARFFSAVFGVGTALAAFHLGRVLFNPRVGLWAGLITTSTILFTVSARAATVDSALTLVTTLAFLFFVMARRRGEGGRGSTEGGKWKAECAKTSRSPNLQISKSPNPPSPAPLLILMYAMIGLAALAKGPVGVLLPAGAIGLYLVATDGWRNVFRSLWWMRPITGIVMMSAVALPWYIEVGRQTDWEWPRRFLLEFNLRPLRQPILGHGDTSALDQLSAAALSLLYYFYHIPALLVGFFPWSILFGPTLVETARQFRRRGVEEGADGSGANATYRDGTRLAVCWFGVWFVFWSVCKTKLPHYLLPAYPAVAMLTACFVEHWLTADESEQPRLRWWLRNAWISVILAGIVIAVALPIVATLRLPGEPWLGLVGLVPIVGGIWCWRESSRGRHARSVVGLLATAVVLLVAVFWPAAVCVDRHQNAKPMIAAIRADWQRHPSNADSSPPIATYGFFRESTVFYAGHPVVRCDDNERTGRTARQDLVKFFQKHPQAYVITRDGDAKEIEQAWPGRCKVLYQERRLLELDDMVVLRCDGERR